MNINIYRFDNYRELLKFFVENHKEKGIKYTFQKLAEELHIQKSYLSKVLSGTANLTNDQMYLFSKIMNLNPKEWEYLNLLLEVERSGLESRKKEIKSEIQKIKKNESKTEKNIQIKMISDKKLEKYYLNPWVQIIHMALTIEKFQENVSQLLGVLNLEQDVFYEHINTLESLGLIKWSGRKIVVINESLHLEKNSPMFWAWRQQIVNMGLYRSKQLSDNSSYTFSVMFTTEAGVVDKIQNLFIDFLKDVERIVSKSKAEELVQMNFDLIPWLKT